MIRRALAYTALILVGGLFQQMASEAGPGFVTESYTWEGSYKLVDGQLLDDGAWRTLWLGYGDGEVADHTLWLSPAVSAQSNETHSALVRSEFSLGSSWDFSVMVSTDVQLRSKKPNPWEVAWIMGDLTEDGSAGLYFTLKPNGVELGAYRNHGLEQQFLFTGNSPTLELGENYEYRLVKDSGWLYAFVDGILVAEAPLDSVAHWNLGGGIGLYTEDAAVRFGEVRVDSVPSSPLSVIILSPSNGSAYDSKTTILFRGAAGTSQQDLSEALRWTSSIDGPLGVGRELAIELNRGTHEISASVTDSSGQTASDSITVTVEAPNPGAAVARVSSISYHTAGGRRGRRHLVVTVSVQDGSDEPVADASVGVNLYLNGTILMSATALTDSEGAGRFRLKNAGAGCYSATITSLEAPGFDWDQSSPPNSYCN